MFVFHLYLLIVPTDYPGVCIYLPMMGQSFLIRVPAWVVKRMRFLGWLRKPLAKQIIKKCTIDLIAGEITHHHISLL